MCLIIDVNVAHEFSRPPSANAIPIINWLDKHDGRMVYGGHLAREMESTTADFRRFVAEHLRAGIAIRIADAAVDREHQRVAGLCNSNDPHVVALALVSGARVLFSDDQALHADFKDPKLLNRPRGAVYQNAKHAHLLVHSSGCVGRRRS